MRLHQPISLVAEDLSLPKAIRARLQGSQNSGQTAYGEERNSTRSKVHILSYSRHAFRGSATIVCAIHASKEEHDYMH